MGLSVTLWPSGGSVGSVSNSVLSPVVPCGSVSDSVLSPVVALLGP